MLDKLELRTNSINPNALNILSGSYIHTGIGDKNYRSCHLFRNYQGMQIVTIKLAPVFPNASYCSFELNPSKIGSFSLMNELVHIISHDQKIIKRLDYATNLNLPITRLREALRVKYKKQRFDYIEKDQLTGFEIGSGLEMYSIYDKGYEKLSRRKYKKIPGAQVNQITRIEVRHRAKKIPHPSYSDLHLYSSYNPFLSLELYKHNDGHIKTEFQAYKAVRLLECIQENGLQGAFKKNNQNNNFKRDYKFLERDLELENQLLTNFQDNLFTFFRS